MRVCASLGRMTATRSALSLRIATMFSVGYEGRTLGDFLQAIANHRVDVLVDVRLTPLSRKRGFSKTALSAALSDRGIDYLHLRELGNPKENRAAFQGPAVASGRRRYLKHLNNGSRHAYEELVELAFTRRVALLCVERDDRRCHRGCITDQAQQEHPALSVQRI